MFFNIQTGNGQKTVEGELVTMHGIDLVFLPVPGGFSVSHYATGLALEPLDAIASPTHPVAFEDAKSGVAAMFETHPDLRAKIVAGAARYDVINTRPGVIA